MCERSKLEMDLDFVVYGRMFSVLNAFQSINEPTVVQLAAYR